MKTFDVFVSRTNLTDGLGFCVEGVWYPTPVTLGEVSFSIAVGAVLKHRSGELVAAPEDLAERAGYQKPENLVAIFRVPVKIIED